MKNNRLDLYNKSVNTLYKAYFNDTLKHGDCNACAVGNLLHCPEWNFFFITCGDKYMDGTVANFRKLFAKEDELIISIGTFMGDYYALKSLEEIKTRWPEEYPHLLAIAERGRKAIEDSGYTKEELARIENVFETQHIGDTEEDRRFNGLVAVLDVLKDIHEIDDNVEDIKKFTTEHERKLELVEA